MSESTESPVEPARKKRTLSADQLAKMQAGAALARAEKARARTELDPGSPPIEGPNGMPLVKVRPAQAPRSLDDVVERHLKGAGDGDAGTDDELPPVEEIADRAEMFTENGDVPPVETNPQLRTRPSLGPVSYTDDAEVPDLGDNIPRNLVDLYSIFPIGDGNHYIYVDRKWPKSFSSVACSGVQQPITSPMSLQDFQDFYGGNAYELTVYGPPRHGATYGTDGRLQVKALTKPIKVHFPGPPNTDSMYAEDDQMMQQPGPGIRHRGPASSGDARLREVELGHQERGEVRSESRLDRERERADAADRLRAQKEKDAMTILAEQRNAELDRVEEARREEMARVERQYQERINALTTNAGNHDPIAMVKALQPLMQGNTGAMEARIGELMTQLRTMEERSRDQASTLDRQVRAADERADARVREAEQRSESRAREERERADARVREAEQRSKESIERMRTDCDREVSAANRRADERVQDTERSHTRDMESQRNSYEARLENMKSGYETQLATLRTELDRVRAEAERYRLEAESNKDVAKQVDKFSRTAEALGFVKDTGDSDQAPPDWKTLLAQVAMSTLPKIPEAIKGAMDIVRPRPDLTPAQIEQIRMDERARMYEASQASAGQMAPPPQQRHRALSGRRPAFATDDGPDFDRSMSTEPQHVEPRSNQRPMAPMGPQPQTFAEAQQMQPAAPPMPMEEPAGAVPPTPSVAPPSAAPQALSLDPQLIAFAAHFRPALEQAFEAGAEADQFASAIVTSYGTELAKQVATQISVEMLVEAIQQLPEGTDSPLVRRGGQKYLREILASVQRMVAVN